MTPRATAMKEPAPTPLRRTWFVTGVAGFIGSNLLEELLRSGHRVIGLDNFATGHRHNLLQVRQSLTPAQWANFKFIEAGLADVARYRRHLKGADVVSHQAALGSVPRSLLRPMDSHASNVTGFLQLLIAAHEAGVRRFVYASSSSVYGDDPHLPKIESRTGHPLSPYAATKAINELYASVWNCCYGLETVGLRYFNVFGRRQDPAGPYAAVIPKWIASLIRRQPVYLNGDGLTSRDFCHVSNVVQANIAAANTANPRALNRAYNIAVGHRTTLNQLFEMLRLRLLPRFPHLRRAKPIYREFRAGDVRHSLADISQARRLLGYRPRLRIEQGLDEALDWYIAHLSPKSA